MGAGFQALVVRPHESPAVEEPSPVQDMVIVGDGIVGKYASAEMMQRTRKLPEMNPQFARRKFEMTLLGEGDGRAYTKGKGYSLQQKANLLRHELSQKPGLVCPLDQNFMKFNTLEPEERRNRNQRPYDFTEDHYSFDGSVKFGRTGEKVEQFSLERFVREHFPEEADDIETRRAVLGAYANYVLKQEQEQTSSVHFGSIHARVVDVEYDLETRIFTLTYQHAENVPVEKIRTRGVMLASGLEGDITLPALKKLQGMPGVYSGESIFSELLPELEKAAGVPMTDAAFFKAVNAMRHSQTLELPADATAALRSWHAKKGLVIGSGLMMNDVVDGLVSAGLSNFIVTSRYGNTHDLPLDLPNLSELENIGISIGDAMSYASLAASGSYEERADKVRDVFRTLKSEVERYNLDENGNEVDDEPLQVRGQTLSRNALSRALLAQYVVFSYEKLRGDLRTRLPDLSNAQALGAMLHDKIDVPFSSWITTARTSTTMRNIVINQMLRDSGRLMPADIKTIIPQKDGRYQVVFNQPPSVLVEGTDLLSPDEVRRADKVEREGDGWRVSWPTPESIVVDYLVSCAGRPVGVLAPGSVGENNSDLTSKLFNRGIYSLHPLGFGVNMDKFGRVLVNQEKFPGVAAIEFYPLSPLAAKGDMYLPANKNRHPLSNTVGEVLPGLRPLIKQSTKYAVYGMANWRPREGVVEYLYHGTKGAGREPEYIDRADYEPLSDSEDDYSDEE